MLCSFEWRVEGVLLVGFEDEVSVLLIVGFFDDALNQFLVLIVPPRKVATEISVRVSGTIPEHGSKTSCEFNRDPLVIVVVIADI